MPCDVQHHGNVLAIFWQHLLFIRQYFRGPTGFLLCPETAPNINDVEVVLKKCIAKFFAIDCIIDTVAKLRQHFRNILATFAGPATSQCTRDYIRTMDFQPYWPIYTGLNVAWCHILSHDQWKLYVLPDHCVNGKKRSAQKISKSSKPPLFCIMV